MDIERFCEKLIQDETLKDIPLTIVFRVAFSIFSIIESGDCFYNNDEGGRICT